MGDQALSEWNGEVAIRPELLAVGPRAGTSLRTLLLLKDVERNHYLSVHAAAKACRADTQATGSRSAIVSQVKAAAADVVLFRADRSWSRGLAELLRTVGGPAPILIGLAQQPQEMLMREFVSWGGDDLARVGSARAVAARLRTIGRDFAGEQERGSGTHRVSPRSSRHFVFLHDSSSRDLSREAYLSRLGHVTLSTTESQEVLRRLSCSDKVGVIVERSWDDEEVRRLLDGAGAHTGYIVLVVQPQQLKAARQACASSRVVVVDSHATADEILYSIHQLESGAVERRAAPRILYGTEVAFRERSGAQADLGFSHNVSPGGLYVRTLATPRGERIWLELLPPRMVEGVQLVGRIAWRTPVSRTRSGAAPPGFGVEIVDGAAACMLDWKRGYRLLAEYCGGEPEASGPLTD